MSRLDLVIFGATGFTGKHAAMEMCHIVKKYPGMSWGVAGRSEGKLNNLLKEVSKKVDEDLSSVKVITAELSDEASLKAMTAQARVLVNCCGPYYLYGEPVVKASIDTKTHYVDVSGEPQFMERMQLVYGSAAREAGVFIISACGFDSIPNDLGVIFLQQNFGGTLNSVESYLSGEVPPEHSGGGVVNYGTWESLVHGMSHHNELPALRKKLYPEKLPTYRPKLKPRFVIHRRGGWCLPFPGSDSSVVFRTQRQLHAEGSRPAQVRTYVRLPSLVSALITMFVASVVFLMSKLSFTRSLLLAYPELFSLGAVRRGPSEDAIRNTRFRFELYGEGWSGDSGSPPDKKMTVRVSGVNPGYGATVHALLHSAITILRHRDRMPAQAGVLTPGAAFRNTDLIQRLCDHGLLFEVVRDQ
ncbi:saccharopine dehydrogenase-like oxidoreductase isoform X2 [Danaus plexippus]|nr:saccharopine dehydrogenase-like oxidoreductase isoform X2 [Danaus plexippus]XP_032516251.2 saccharopine dehydrogenase-like oxidoreductase isoform X2 [Danaus plexippus]